MRASPKGFPNTTAGPRPVYPMLDTRCYGRDKISALLRNRLSMRYGLLLLIIGAACTSTVQSPPAAAGPSGPGTVERPIQRAIPMTNVIQRAFVAGTRD